MLIPIRKRDVPTGLVPIDRDERGRLILAEGETTGHCHAILERGAELFRQADLDEMADRFLRVEEECTTVHEEHDTVTLDEPARSEDWYVVRHKREYHPQEIRRVID